MYYSLKILISYYTVKVSVLFIINEDRIISFWRHPNGTLLIFLAQATLKLCDDNIYELRDGFFTFQCKWISITKRSENAHVYVVFQKCATTVQMIPILFIT